MATTGITLSNTSNLTTGQRILVANAILANEPSAPNPDLIDSKTIPQGHKQWDEQVYARLANASALTEGVDLAQVQQLVTSTLTITPAENGILVTISKRLIRRQGDLDVVSGAGKMLGKSLRRLMDADVITLYDGFSKSIVGATATLDITHFRGATAYLLTDNNTSFGPAEPPLFAALHIEQISDIILDITDPGAVVSSRFGMSAELLQRWWRGSDRLYAVQVFHAGNITRDSGDDAKGAIFARPAAVIVVANESEPTVDDDKSLRAIEYGIFQEWATGERADVWGVEVFSDAASTV